MIGLLYRSAYYAEDEEKRQQMAGRANLHLAKNRNGPTGTFRSTSKRNSCASPPAKRMNTTKKANKNFLSRRLFSTD